MKYFLFAGQGFHSLSPEFRADGRKAFRDLTHRSDGALPGKLLFKEFDILSGNPQGFSNFVCGNFFGPDGPVNGFGIHLQDLCHLGNRQKLVCNTRLEPDPPIPGKGLQMLRLTDPYPLRDLVREGITSSRFRTQEVFATTTRSRQYLGSNSHQFATPSPKISRTVDIRTLYSTAAA